MTECDHVDCNRDAVGAVKWKAQSGTLEREYCPIHIRDTKALYPDLIEEVDLM